MDNELLFDTLDEFINEAPTSIIRNGRLLAAHLLMPDVTINAISQLTKEEFTIKINSVTSKSIYEVELIFENDNVGSNYDTDPDDFDEYDDSTYIDGYCQCEYYKHELNTCKHQIAAAIIWQSKIKHTNNVVPLKIQAPNTLQMGAKKNEVIYNICVLTFTNIKPYLPHTNLNYSNFGYKYPVNNKIKLSDDGQSYVGNFSVNITTVITYTPNRCISITCECTKLTPTTFCEHACKIINYIQRQQATYYFTKFFNYDDDKKALLIKNNIPPNSVFEKDIKFNINQNGVLEIGILPQNFIVSTYANAHPIEALFKTSTQNIDIKLLKDFKTVGGTEKGGLLFNFDFGYWSYFKIEAIIEQENKNGAICKKANSIDINDSGLFNLVPEGVKTLISKTNMLTIKNHLIAKKLCYTYANDNNYHLHLGTAGDKEAIEYINRNLIEAKDALVGFDTIYIQPKDKSFAKANLQKVSISNLSPQLKFELKTENDILALNLNVYFGNNIVTNYETFLPFLKIENELFLLEQLFDSNILNIFKAGNLYAPVANKTAFLNNIVIPISKKYEVNFGDILNTKTINQQPIPQVYLTEMEQFLIIKINWKYGQYQLDSWHQKSTIINEATQMVTIPRQAILEQQHIDTVKALHPVFTTQTDNYFYIPIAECLKNKWFITFIQSLKAAHIEVYGIKELKKIRLNTATPTVNITSSNSNTDWFDLNIEIDYDGQTVTLAELKKALNSNQEYVALSDGSLGMLPEEWINKFKHLLHIGSVKNNTVKLSKINFTLLDNLHAEIDNQALLLDLEEKKNALKNINLNQKFKVPKAINATLRNYQIAGFEWLSLLNKMQWGGCLADDMGLGKTIQTITFLQAQIEAKNYPHLIVCPTSLIYNWQAELEKFAPNITFLLHYGSNRIFDEKTIENTHIVITSYGNLRSDIEKFSTVKFGYAVLDESQAIKNPTAQITKAVQLIKAKNRLLLSGTPVQNNTFDLYAQMNFLNPGMLGSQDYFRTEFANPIDKNGDQTKVAELQKIIYPFMLRRTKEVVAKDLPDKTESILWCEMGKDQRKIYNTFKTHYRDTLMGKIESVGMGKSSFMILEALLKLRQICNSPAILNDDVVYPNHSIKLEEIVREVTQNVGKHKALIFSQFTSMLGLIETELKNENITTLYLDGGTKATERSKLVTEFQTNANISVFLISLKAGGVGLNLTAADYVYLIDPWWNPAVEAQAIDRTHRIGQTNKVFAYKMICKDTIEEKILKLQEKKKTLSQELVGNESGFIKKLTKDDIAYLFD